MFALEVIEKAATPDDIEALAVKLEPALARAVRSLLTEHVQRIDLDDLEAALKDHNHAKVLEIIGQVDPVKAQAVREQVQNAIWAGGALAADDPVFREAKFVFNRLNPELLRWIDRYDLNLIRSVDASTRANVQKILRDGMSAGQNPVEQARAIRTVVSLTENQAAGVGNFRKALETVHLKRSVKGWGLKNERSRQSGLDTMPLDAKGKPKDGINEWRLRDQRFDATIARAVETTTPLKPEQIDKMVARYQEKAIKHRAQTIARTESIRTLNVGVQETWRQAIEDRKVNGDNVRKMWRVAKDERLCKVCGSIPKANPKRGVPLQGTFAVPENPAIALPPQHPNCRCGVQIRLWEPSQLQE